MLTRHFYAYKEEEKNISANDLSLYSPKIATKDFMI